jgi:hypothetical protein
MQMLVDLKQFNYAQASSNIQILYINSLCLSICDGGFGGWGKGEASEATAPRGDTCHSVTGCGFRVTMQAPVL